MASKYDINHITWKNFQRYTEFFFLVCKLCCWKWLTDKLSLNIWLHQLSNIQYIEWQMFFVLMDTRIWYCCHAMNLNFISLLQKTSITDLKVFTQLFQKHFLFIVWLMNVVQILLNCSFYSIELIDWYRWCFNSESPVISIKVYPCNSSPTFISWNYLSVNCLVTRMEACVSIFAWSKNLYFLTTMSKTFAEIFTFSTLFLFTTNEKEVEYNTKRLI